MINKYSIIEFALEHRCIGDLFGGAKGSYGRNLLRISAMPLVERELHVNWSRVREIRIPGEWRNVAELVRRSGYYADYYVDLYHRLEFAYTKDLTEISEMIVYVVHATSEALWSDFNSKRILVDEPPNPKNFAARLEEGLPDQLNLKFLNCDPDELRLPLHSFIFSLHKQDEVETAWEFRGAPVAPAAAAWFRFRRVSPIAVCLDGGRLTDRVPAVQVRS